MLRCLHEANEVLKELEGYYGAMKYLTIQISSQLNNMQNPSPRYSWNLDNKASSEAPNTTRDVTTEAGDDIAACVNNIFRPDAAAGARDAWVSSPLTCWPRDIQILHKGFIVDTTERTMDFSTCDGLSKLGH